MFVHLICLGFTGFVAYTAKPNWKDPVWFAWHPTLMAAAFSFLAAESVLMFSRKRSMLGDGAPKSSRVLGHWLVMVIAVASALLGVLAIYTTKEAYGKPHLVSPHGILGCVTVCYAIAQSFAGTNLLLTGLAKKLIDINLLGKLHALSGTFLLLLAALTTLGGVASDWFMERVTGPAWYACIASPLVVYSVIAIQVLGPKIMGGKKTS